MRNNKILPITVATVLSLGTIFSTVPTFAQNSTQSPAKMNFFDGLASFLADKFNLNESQVQVALDEFHVQQKSEIDKKKREMMENRLEKLVQNGKITEDQKTAILAELKTLQNKYNPESMKDLSLVERKAKMDQMLQELKDWAKSHNIDSSYLMPEFGMRKGMHHRMWRENFSSPTPTPTQ